MDGDELQGLRKRLEVLEDEREIRYLLGRYGHYADCGHSDEWVDQWTKDGVYDLVTVKRDGAGYAGARRFQGRDELAAMIRDLEAHKLLEGRSLHLQDVNLVIQITGDTATAQGYSITLLRDRNTIRIRSAGLVRWQFRRVSGRWRIAEKKRRIVGDSILFEDARRVSAHDAAKGAS